MSSILITGATGNIGAVLIRYLIQNSTNHRIVAGVRNIEKAKHQFKDITMLEYISFDFDDFTTHETAFSGVDTLFLLRPPHIADVEKYFRPLLLTAKNSGIQNIVFLSVQGVEKSSVIPHHKIEKLITEFQFNFIFLRPSYFMQNLTTTLYNDIKTKCEIILPAGNAKFNWVDIENIGDLAAIMLNDFEKYKNKPYEITGTENECFEHVTSLINNIVSKPIRYRNVNPFRFFGIKSKEGMEKGMIMVMIMLHFLPRFQSVPAISDNYEQITGKNPTNLKSFIEREKALFEG